MKKIEFPQLAPTEVWFGFIILEAALMLSMACHQYYSEKKAEENETNTIEGQSFDTFENEEDTILEEQDTNIGEIGELIPENDIPQVDEECQWEDDYIAATLDMDPVIKEDVKCYCLIK